MAPVNATRKEKEKITQNIGKKLEIGSAILFLDQTNAPGKCLHNPVTQTRGYG